MKQNTNSPRRWNSKFLQLFLEKGAIHGLPYVGMRRLTVLERILWCMLTIVAIYMSLSLALESLDRFKTKSTVISIERDYHYWNTTLPSITICPMTRLSLSKFDEFCAAKNISGQDKDELFQFLETLANSTYFNFDTIKEFPSIDKLNVNPKDYMCLIYNLTANLLEFSSTNEPVKSITDDGTIHTQQVLTEWGICYTTNNYIIEDLSTSNLLFGVPAKSNYYDEDEILCKTLSLNMFDSEVELSFIGFQGPTQIFIHGAHEVMKVEKRIGKNEAVSEIQAKMYEITASDEFAKSTTVQQRQCRFPHEAILPNFPIYTMNLCHQQCRIDLAFRLCKCIPHFYPNRDGLRPVCHYKVLKSCIFKYAGVFEHLNEIEKLALEDDPITCNCVPNCRSSEILEIKSKPLTETDDLIGGNGAYLLVSGSPLLRYRRQIIFSLTDLLVSIGGTAGFFLGSSVLSAVEILYYFTVRLICHCFGYKE